MKQVTIELDDIDEFLLSTHKEGLYKSDEDFIKQVLVVGMREMFPPQLRNQLRSKFEFLGLKNIKDIDDFYHHKNSLFINVNGLDWYITINDGRYKMTSKNSLFKNRYPKNYTEMYKILWTTLTVGKQLNAEKTWGLQEEKNLTIMLKEGFAISTISIQFQRSSFAILKRAEKIYQHFDVDRYINAIDYNDNYESILTKIKYKYPAHFFKINHSRLGVLFEMHEEGYVPEMIEKEIVLNIDAIKNEISLSEVM
jgi:hypothetical protein